MTWKKLKQRLLKMSKKELKQEALVVDPNDEVAAIEDIRNAGDLDIAGASDKERLVLKSGKIL
jgi:hypothetical protein